MRTLITGLSFIPSRPFIYCLSSHSQLDRESGIAISPTKTPMFNPLTPDLSFRTQCGIQPLLRAHSARYVAEAKPLDSASSAE